MWTGSTLINANFNSQNPAQRQKENSPTQPITITVLVWSSITLINANFDSQNLAQTQKEIHRPYHSPSLYLCEHSFHFQRPSKSNIILDAFPVNSLVIARFIMASRWKAFRSTKRWTLRSKKRKLGYWKAACECRRSTYEAEDLAGSRGEE